MSKYPTLPEGNVTTSKFTLITKSRRKCASLQNIQKIRGCIVSRQYIKPQRIQCFSEIINLYSSVCTKIMERSDSRTSHQGQEVKNDTRVSNV